MYSMDWHKIWYKAFIVPSWCALMTRSTDFLSSTNSRLIFLKLKLIWPLKLKRYPWSFHRYECLATNAVGIAKRTILLEVRTDSPSFSHQPPAPLPIPPTQRHGVPSRQHSVSAMYGSAVFLHCPESSGTTRGTIWQLPSKTIMEHRYRYLTFVNSWMSTTPTKLFIY